MTQSNFFRASPEEHNRAKAPAGPGESEERLDEESSDVEDDAYFEEIEMSSYLRAFKELGATDTLFQLLHGHILTKQIDQITKEAYQAKSQSVSQGQDPASPGAADSKLPLAVFTEAVMTRIVKGSLKNLLNLTTNVEGENYVADYALLDECLWPLLVRAVDTTLSFVTSTANLELF